MTTGGTWWELHAPGHLDELEAYGLRSNATRRSGGVGTAA